MSRWQSKLRQTKTLSGKQMLARQRLSLFLTFHENEWWRWRNTPQKHGDYDIDWDGKIDAMPRMHPFFKNGFREHYRIRPTESRASTMGFLDLLSPFPWVFDTGQSCLWKWTVPVFPASAFSRNSQNCMLRHRWRSPVTLHLHKHLDPCFGLHWFGICRVHFWWFPISAPWVEDFAGRCSLKDK